MWYLQLSKPAHQGSDGHKKKSNESYQEVTLLEVEARDTGTLAAELDEACAHADCDNEMVSF